MSSEEGTTAAVPDVALLLDDVGWHQGRASRQAVLAFVALGAGIVPMMRLVVGLRSWPAAEDPWGPIDGVVIVAGLLLWCAAAVSFSAARRHARLAAVLASCQVVDGRGARVRDASRARILRRQVESGAWRVIPVDALLDRDRYFQLLIAARNRPGSRHERIQRFGRRLASRYARAVVVRRLALGVLIAVEIGATVLGVVGIFAGGTGRHALVTTAVATLFAVLAVSPVVGILLRRSPVGLLHLADPLFVRLREQDPRLTRGQVAAMLRKPRLYDVWLGVRVRSDDESDGAASGSEL